MLEPFISQKEEIATNQHLFILSLVPTMHEKPYFLFSNVLKRWSFQKNRTGIWSFLYYQKRWYFFFQKIWSYTLGAKGKMISFKQILGNIWKDGISFLLQKIWYFFFRRKMKQDDLYQKIHANMIFSVYMYKCYKYGIASPARNTKISLSRKDIFKGDISSTAEKDNIHPRKYDISVEAPYWLTF